MSDPKSPVPGATWFQLGTILVVLALAWAALDARSQSAQITLQDHEARLRVVERDVLSSLARIEQQLVQIEGKRP